ncbi:hypothetical protein [Herbiconiux liukaitaii]|uniref:hypothetical protein n=1 Tax=Herbiconiux liukaitaii TaxID=3342799 RepID=UPI0035B78CA2
MSEASAVTDGRTGGGVEGAGRGRGRARVRVIVIGVSLLVLGVVALIAWSVARTAQGPDHAVREYVALLEARDATGANAVVDPAQWVDGTDGDAGGGSGGDAGGGDDGNDGGGDASGGDAGGGDDGNDGGGDAGGSDDGGGDPAGAGAGAGGGVRVGAALVSDGVLGSSLERFRVTDVELAFGESADVPVGGTATVLVEYLVGDDRGSAALRAERQDDAFLGFTRWSVIDPLVVPVVVESNVPSAGPATLGGEPITLSGPEVEGAEQVVTLVYPGEYQLAAPTRTYLSAGSEYLLVTDDATESVPDPAGADPTSIQLWFDPTAELVDTVTEALAEHLDECVEAGAAMPEQCPAELGYLARESTGLRITLPPEIDFLGAAQTEYVDGSPTEPTLRMRSTPGVAEYTGSDGARYDDTFFVSAGITAEGDDVEIVFGANG